MIYISVIMLCLSLALVFSLAMFWLIGKIIDNKVAKSRLAMAIVLTLLGYISIIAWGHGQFDKWDNYYQKETPDE